MEHMDPEVGIAQMHNGARDTRGESLKRDSFPESL